MFRRRRRDSLPLFSSDFLPFCLILLTICSSQACKSSQPTQAALRKQTLILAHENPYLSLDPQAWNDSVTWSVVGNIFEPLVEFDHNMRIVGRLAERWENPNDLTWRFYLRKNVRFHDGKPFSSRDVEFTIHRGLSDNRAGTRPYLISVKEAKAVDSLTVDVITDRPNPVLLNRLTFIFILPALGTPQDVIQKPVGTGPYMFEREEFPGRKLLLRANPTYWGGKPSIERVQFVSLESENRLVEALLKGETHVIRDFAERFIPRVEASATCRLVTHDGLGVSFLGFNLTENGKSNPFRNLKVREAIHLGLDNTKLVAQGLEGRATVALQLVSPVIFGYDQSRVPEPTDRTRAKQLLKQAGFARGFRTEIYGHDEQRLSLVAAQIRELGLDVEARIVNWPDLNEKMLNHEVPMYTISWFCSTGDASDFLDSCIHSPDPDAGYGNFNVAGYRNQEVDHLIELSGQTLKTNERKEYLQRALSLASKDVPYIPLYSRFRHYGVSKDLSWQPRRDGRLYAADMTWKQAQ